jgi:alkylhydroperoxidase family enzyme
MSTTPRLPSAIAGLPPTFPATILPHQPELFATFRDMYGTFWSKGVLDHPTKEVARLHNARRTDCGVCRNIRFSRARAEGLTEDLVDMIDDGYPESGLSERYKLVLAFVDAFLADEYPSDSVRAGLSAEMSEEQIVELGFGLAVFLGFAKMLIVLEK